MLKEQFQWFLENRDELIKRYNDKFIVIKDKQVVDVYNEQDIAYFECEKKYEPNTYIIQKCSADKWSFTQSFQSKVIFA